MILIRVDMVWFKHFISKDIGSGVAKMRLKPYPKMDMVYAYLFAEHKMRLIPCMHRKYGLFESRWFVYVSTQF
jgi:hypothetical protein